MADVSPTSASSDATPLLTLKLGACSCLVFAGDSGQPDLGEELDLSPSQPGEGEDQRYTPTSQQSAQRPAEDRRPSKGRSNAGAGEGASVSKSVKWDSNQELGASPGGTQQQQPPETSSETAVPPLGPLGCGGWYLEDQMTEDMWQVSDEAIEQYEREEKKRLTEWHLDFLTPAVLVNYIEPLSVQPLVATLKSRTQNEDLLSFRKDIFLNNSLRVVGWDGDGVTIVSQETCTVRRSGTYGLDHFHYLWMTAMDLNKPGANGIISVNDFGGGVNLLHFLDPRPMAALASMLEGPLRGRSQVSYMVEMPPSFERIMSFCMRCVEESERKKVVFVATSEELLELLKQKGCDEETLATCRASMENRRQSGAAQKWFPIVDHSFFKDKLADLGWNQDLQYVSGKHHLRLREAVQQFRIWKWGVPEACSEGAAPDAAAGPISAAVGSGARERRRSSDMGRAESAICTGMDGGDQSAPLLGKDARQTGRKARPRSLFKRVMGCLVCGACGK